MTDAASKNPIDIQHRPIIFRTFSEKDFLIFDLAFCGFIFCGCIQASETKLPNYRPHYANVNRLNFYLLSMVRHKFWEFFGLYIGIVSAIIGLLAYLPASNKLKKYFYKKKDDGTIDKRKSIIYSGVLGTITLCGYLAYMSLPPIPITPGPTIPDSIRTQLSETSSTSVEKTKLMILTLADSIYDQNFSSAIRTGIKPYIKKQEVVLSPLVSKNCFNEAWNGNLSCILKVYEMQTVLKLILIKYYRKYQIDFDSSILVDGEIKICVANLQTETLDFDRILLHDNDVTEELAREKINALLVDSTPKIILKHLKL